MTLTIRRKVLTITKNNTLTIKSGKRFRSIYRLQLRFHFLLVYCSFLILNRFGSGDIQNDKKEVQDFKNLNRISRGIKSLINVCLTIDFFVVKLTSITYEHSILIVLR